MGSSEGGREVNSVQWMTQSAYARHRGVAKSAVHRAVSERRITLADGKIDAVAADRDWARNTRARGDSARPAAASAVAPRLAKKVATPPPAPVPTPAPLAAALPAADRQLLPGETPEEYAVSRARREQYEADLAQMKVLELQGELVRAVEVRAEIAKQIGQLRANLMQIPARLLHMITPEAHAALTAEIRANLSNLSGSF